MEGLREFFEVNGYVVELMICNFLFCLSQKRRRRYVPRLLLAVAVMLLSAPALNSVQSDSGLYNLLKYIVWFSFSVFGNAFLYEITLSVSVFISIAAFICQHLSFKVGEIVLFFLPDAVAQRTYNAPYVLTQACMYAFSYFVFARRFKRLNVRHARRQQLLLIYIVVAVYITILQFYFTGYMVHIPTTLYMIYASFDIICCTFAMMLQFGIIETSSLKEEGLVMEHVLHMQQEKYSLSKETIELINVKFHDLKKRLTVSRALDEEEARELYKTLEIYDMALKSGNEALDIVLAEKGLVCEREHIRLECIADGANLAFMAPSDVYSLVGNAIDNAVESVQKICDANRRFINVSIRKSRELLVINIENPYEGELRFKDGLPQTTKADKNFHGFGMKSIRMVVEKYNGFLSIAAEDGLFTLNIVFTPQQGKPAA